MKITNEVAGRSPYSRNNCGPKDTAETLCGLSLHWHAVTARNTKLLVIANRNNYYG
jgi:hypothetical protein